MKHLQTIDPITISLFSNLISKGVGRHPKIGRKKGSVKVHTVIYANEGASPDVRFTSAATNDSFMPQPANFSEGDIIAMGRAYIGYEKFEELTQRGVIYVTKMKKNLAHAISKDVICQSLEGVVLMCEQCMTFTKHKTKVRKEIKHQARIITYIGHKNRPISLLTNDMELPCEEIIEIYHRLWDTEPLSKQIKQNFPLEYFYGESANAIKLQIWITLIANLLLMIMKRGLMRSWSLSDLATMVRIALIYYIAVR